MDDYGPLVVSWAQGYKGDQVQYIDAENICYACGNVVKFVNVTSGDEQAFQSPGNGISKIATSPSSGVFAVAECGLKPRIFVFQFPTMDLLNVLEGGAELEYNQLAFSLSTNYLAATSGIPGFMLMVWDYTNGTLRCKEKLLSEEPLTSMLFNPLHPNQLSLVGNDQLTIWTIEECNEVATLTSRSIGLPASDGTVIFDQEESLSRSGTRMGFNVPLPSSTRAGLQGDATKVFVAPNLRHPRVEPTSQCWSSRGELLVGCSQGQLFKVNPDGQTDILLGGMNDSLLLGDIEPGMFSCLAANISSVFAGGTDGGLRQITIDNKGIKITELEKVSEPISSLAFSPVMFTEFAYGTSSGSLYSYNTVKRAHNIIAATATGNFVGIGFSSGGKYCITCREDGELQAWESESGSLIESISLATRVTSLACCPSSLVVAVGTWTGHVVYVDVTSLYTEEGGPLREVWRSRLHHSPTTFLQYDNSGCFLLSASDEENQVFVVDPRPSNNFECIGYVDCGGPVVNLTVHQQKNNGTSTVVATTTSSPSNDDPPASNLLVIFHVTEELLRQPEDHFQSLRRNFKDASISCAKYELSCEVDAAVATCCEGQIEVAALSKVNKRLLKFKLPSTKRQSQSEETTLIAPISDHPGHDLGGGFLALSLHGKWLASSSPDGRIVIRDLQDWSKIVSTLAHSFMEGGASAIAFSQDTNQIASIGLSDSSLVCFTWEFTAKGQLAVNSAVEFARHLHMKLRSQVELEGQALDNMDEWTPPGAMRAVSSSASDVQPEEGDRELEERPLTGAPSEITMTPTPTPGADVTWLDNRILLAVREESGQYDQVKRDLRKQIKEMRKTILQMKFDNDNLPEMEQLRHDEYNLDTEEQKRMQETQDRSVQEVREEIYYENLAQKYLAYLVKKDCWDDMVTKGRAINAFNSSMTVSNYPTLAVTSDESALLEKVTRMRKIEIAANAARKEIVEASTSKTSAGGGGEEEDDEEEKVGGAGGVGISLHGSLGPNYGGASEVFYSQFDLHTREEKISQIVLVKDAIRRIKDAFNEAFSNVFRNKEQEIGRIKERNVRIRKIMEELDLGSDAVEDPSLSNDEMPENAFTVKDEEVTVERVLSEEQRREKEAQEQEEEERKMAARGDNKRERALNDMMGGVLQVKKEDMLKQDIPPPDFVTEKLEKDWTEEEKKKLKEYEKKQKDLQEEREKYRKNLENELKKLQQSNVDGMNQFDESLAQLFTRRVKVDMVVNQEELKIIRLTHSIMVDDELTTHNVNLNYLFELKNKLKAKSTDLEVEVRRLVDEYREVYDSIVAEDKMLDRGFKRDFSDVPLSLSDQLYKLFRRRPRAQRQRTLADRSGSLNPYDGGSDRGIPSIHAETKVTLDALDELDADVNIPEGCDPQLWGRLCQSRRIKVESEIRVKRSAVTLAEMTQYLQRRQEEDEAMARQIDDITKQQTKLCEDVMKNQLNVEVQFLLKQGRVEITSGQFIQDYSDSILIHRGVVEDLNGTIRGLGESKVAAMTESKDFKKGIHQLEWERKRMLMQMEDLHNKARHIQMLKLTKDLQAFLNEDNHSSKQSKQMAVLEQTLALQDKQLQKSVAHKNEQTQHLHRTIRNKEHENMELDKILEELHVSVSERKNIADVNASERAKSTSDKRLKGIVQRRKLVDLAKAQAQEVAVLRAEVERLRMKTFPALVQVER